MAWISFPIAKGVRMGIPLGGRKGVRALCEASGVYPCILDAAIFASKDGDAWTEANVIY